MARTNEIQRELSDEIRWRKSVGKSSWRRKNGSKSKKCSLPSDHYTKKQLKGMNGELMIRNLSKPMEWDEFKTMSIDLQKEYLKKLVDQHCADAGSAAEMFGIKRNSLLNYTHRHGINGIFRASGGKRSAEKEAKWQAFLTGEVYSETSEATEQPAIPNEEPVTHEVQPLDYIKRSPMACEASINLNFHGKFDMISFMETVMKHIDEGQEVVLNVSGTIIEKWNST